MLLIILNKVRPRERISTDKTFLPNEMKSKVEFYANDEINFRV